MEESKPKENEGLNGENSNTASGAMGSADPSIGKENPIAKNSNESAITVAVAPQESEIPSAIDDINAEYRDIEEQIDEELQEKTPSHQRLDSLGRRLKQLDQLLLIEDPKIKSRAIEILRNGNPMDFIINVYSRLHVGDIVLGIVLLLSIVCQSILNSEGLQPKLSGASGKGKTHAAKAMFHLIADVGYKIEGSLSAKSLFYHPDLVSGTVVFSDDVRISADLEDTLKRAMSNFQQKTKHYTVSKDRQSQSLEIPERITWWQTSVDNHFSDELLNRLFGLDVDDSTEQDNEVTKYQLEMAKRGDVALPEDEDVLVCRSIIHIIKSKLFKVDIPFADRIEWKGSEDRRNLPRFLDLIRAFAALRFMQRYEFLENEILADIKDFDDAKALFEQGKAGLTTKLTIPELRLVEWMVGKGAMSINDIVKGYMKPNGKPYTHEAIRKMLEGKKGGQGLVDKVPGMMVTGSGGKGDEKKYQITTFDDRSSLEIVSLRSVSNTPASKIS